MDPSPLSMLCACRQHAGNQHWSHRSPPGGAGAIACASCMVGQTQNARERAHERRWGEVWRVGMGWAAHRKSLIFECPISFNHQLTNPCQLTTSGLPLLVTERKRLGGAWGEALMWSIIDLAREHSFKHKDPSADSRVGIAGGRSQQGGVARGQYVQCGGAGRGSVALTGSRHCGDAPAPASCMESLSSCAQMLAQLSEPSGDP